MNLSETSNKEKLFCRKRIENLKKQILSTHPEVESERAVLLTRAYKDTEGKPTVIRRAIALKRILEEMTIYIGKDELIVGNRSIKPRCAPQFPEMSVDWIEEELERFEIRAVDKFLCSNEVKAKLRETLPYWRGKTLCDKATEQMPEETRKAKDANVFTVEGRLANGAGHILPDYEEVIKFGLKKKRQMALENLEKLEYQSNDDFHRMNFWKATIMVIDGTMGFAKRYADLARKLAEEETDNKRKMELEKIGEICDWVPGNPSRNFWEAVQSFWFVHLICHIETDGISISPGRFDQYMYPYYKKGLKEKTLSKEKTQEIVGCLWLKFNEIVELFPEKWAYYVSGFPMGQNLIIGGLTEDGEDATNELSYICLNVASEMRLPQPNFSVRLHKKSPQTFRFKVAEVIKLGYGMPACFNDEIIIPALLIKGGIALEDARNYAIVGCVEVGIPGKTQSLANAGYLNLAKILELALNNGKCRISRENIGIASGDPREFKTFDQSMDAFCKQLRFWIRHLIIASNTIEIVHTELVPTPFLSTLIHDCVERGKDVLGGGAIYNFSSVQAVGIANVANSLAAIKRLVYEEKTLEMSELMEALDNNFEGRRELRQALVNKAPKYGNDKDYVDLLARKLSVLYAQEVGKYKNPRGGKFQPGFYSVSSHVPLGKVVGATPDGRKSEEPLADGVSPFPGTDMNGPTAVCKSVAKLEHILASNGTLLNLKFNPKTLEGEKGSNNLAALIKSFFELGGLHLQFNVISADILKKAQRQPERYKSLVVRVAGYSAFFVELTPEIQEDIIRRTEHSMSI